MKAETLFCKIMRLGGPMGDLARAQNELKIFLLKLKIFFLHVDFKSKYSFGKSPSLAKVPQVTPAVKYKVSPFTQNKIIVTTVLVNVLYSYKNVQVTS